MFYRDIEGWELIQAIRKMDQECHLSGVWTKFLQNCKKVRREIEEIERGRTDG